MRQPARQRDINERRPDHVTRDRDVETEQREVEREGRQPPQQREKGEDTDDLGDQLDAFVEDTLDEQAAIVGDALVGIVDLARAVALGQSPIGAVGEPRAEGCLGQ
jgi:hypothetical protein